MKKDGQDWKDLFIAPKDYKYTLSFQQRMASKYNGYDLQIPVIEGFNPKNYREELFLSEDGDEIKQSDIFSEDSRIGINKDYKGKSRDSGFYKQISYRLGKKDDIVQYRFAFYADITGDCPEKVLVSVGGDNSQFLLQTIDKEKSDYP
jgi:CRISPR-associated protein Cmr3